MEIAGDRKHQNYQSWILFVSEHDYDSASILEVYLLRISGTIWPVGQRGCLVNKMADCATTLCSPCKPESCPIKDGAKTRYKLEPDPEDSISIKVVRRIFEMALKRIGCKQIAMTLNREGFFTSTGQRWGKTTVHKILNNDTLQLTITQ